MENIPIYDVVLGVDDTEGVNIVSLVTSPAIGVNWIAFNQDRSYVQMMNEDEHKIFGAVLIPDQNVLRRDGEGKPYFMRFAKDTIEAIRDKFMYSGKGAKANAEHEPIILEGVYMIESFIKDSKRGMMPPEQFQTLPDGTWFASFKVDNPQVWDNLIKTGQFTGFSIEGFMGLKSSGQSAPITSDMKFSKELLTRILKLEKYI